MLDISLNVQKWNDANNIINVKDMCSNIRVYSSIKNLTTELQFTINYEYNNYYYYNFELGDSVYFNVDGQLLFSGKITDSEFNLNNNTQTFTCYDLIWWVCKNNITYNFDDEDMSIKQALYTVFWMFNFDDFTVDTTELGKYADMKISKHRIINKPAKDVLLAIMSDVTRMTGTYYYLHMNARGKVVITECDKYYSNLTIQKSSDDVANGNLIDYTVTRSMQNMVNRYRLYDSKYKKISDIYVENNLFYMEDVKKQYGIIQETVVLNKDEDLETSLIEDENNELDETAQAKIANAHNAKLLKLKNKLQINGYPSVDIVVKCLGDVNYKVGHGVMCKLPDSSFYDKFMYITASEFEFIPNSDHFISTLTLSESKHKDLTTWEDIEEVVTDENGNVIQGEGSLQGNSNVVKKALEWAYQTANDDNIGYSMNMQLRNGPDYYDCSAFVIHAYRYAGLTLSKASYTGNMYDSFLAEGFADVTKEVNLKTGQGLIPGDVLLNIIDHTEMYTGDNKMIGARTSKVPKKDQISEKEYRNYPYNYVLRYTVTEEKEEETTSSSSNESSSGGSSNGKVSDKYIEILKELEGFSATIYDDGAGVPTLGYGFTGTEIGGRTTITRQEADKLLREKINGKNYAGAVKKKLDSCGISLTQNKFDALVDLAYNAGSGYSDKAIDKYISGGDNAICDYFKSIIYAGGKVMQGLVKRRNLNVDMWLNSKYYNPY